MAIVKVQGANKVVTGTNNTTLAFPSNVTAGNLLVVTHCHYEAAGSAITTPTDTRSHTYVAMAAEQQAGGTGAMRTRSFYVANCTGGACTVTFDLVGSASAELAVAVSEWSGVKTTSPLSSSTTAGPVTDAAPTSGNVTPAEIGSLFYAGLVVEANNVSVTKEAAWTVSEQNVPVSSIPISTVYLLAPNTNADDADWTLGTSARWLAHVGLFLPEPAASINNQNRLLKSV